MAEFLNKFKAWIIAGVGLLLYWLGRKDEKIKQIDTKQKGQLNAIHQANVARNTRFESERIKRLQEEERRKGPTLWGKIWGKIEQVTEIKDKDY